MSFGDWMIFAIVVSMAFCVAWYCGPIVLAWLEGLWRR